MSLGKRLGTDEPLTEHDVAERLDRAASRVLRILWDTRQLGLAQQVRASRYLTSNTLGILRAELDLWDIEPAPLSGQLDPLTPDAQAVADAYSRWLNTSPTTGVTVSEQSTEQNPAETASTAVNVTGSEPDVNVHQHSGEGSDSSGEDKASDSAPSETTDSAKDGGSAE